MSLRSLEYAAILIVEPLCAWFTAAMNVLTRRSFDEVLPQGLLKCAPGSGSHAAAAPAVAPVVSRASATTAPNRLSMRGLFRLWFPRCDPATRAGPPVRRGGAFPGAQRHDGKPAISLLCGHTVRHTGVRPSAGRWRTTVSGRLRPRCTTGARPPDRRPAEAPRARSGR